MSDPILATYISSSSFSISGDQTAEYVEGRKVYMYQGVNGEANVYIASSSYGAGITTVNVSPSIVFDTLVNIKLGPTVAANTGHHDHSGIHQGGQFEINNLIFPAGGVDGMALVKDGEDVEWGSVGSGDGGATSAQTWILHMMGIGL